MTGATIARADAAAPLPLVVIAGWLGAGKTTLVNHLLRHAGGRRIAVLVNDFGDIAIDAELIEQAAAQGASVSTGAEGGADGAASASVLNLTGGCLCCSFGDDLVGTLAGLARRDPRPDVVVIETSGVALPAEVVRTARLAAAVRPAGTWVLADAAAVRAQADDRYVGDTVRRQLGQADWVVLNKPDLAAGAPALADLDAWLAGAAPAARRITAPVRELPAELVLGWREVDEGEVEGEVEGGEAAAQPLAAGSGDGDALERMTGRAIGTGPSGHGEGRRAGERFESLTLHVPAGVDPVALARQLEAADAGILRAKGFVTDATGQRWLVQLAGTRTELTPWPGRGEGRLVLIGLRGRLLPPRV